MQLLTVPADGEERVVDGDAEADERAHVDRVVGDVQDPGEQEHHGDPSDDRQRTDEDREDRRDPRAEDQKQHEDGQRQGQELGAEQIVLQRDVQIARVRQLARAGDRERRRPELRADGGVCRERVPERALQRDQREGRPGLGVDHVECEGRRGVVPRHHALDAWVVSHGAERLGLGRLEVLVAGVHCLGVENRDDSRVHRVAEHLLHDRLSPLRLEPLESSRR